MGIKSLLHSRKFWLTVLAMTQTLLFHFVADFPPEVWASIDAVLIVLIGSIAAEDFATKLGGGTPGK